MSFRMGYFFFRVLSSVSVLPTATPPPHLLYHTHLYAGLWVFEAYLHTQNGHLLRALGIRNTPKQGSPPRCKDVRWGCPGKQDFSGPRLWSHFNLDPPCLHPTPTPRITLLVHRIMVVHTAMETQFLRNA